MKKFFYISAVAFAALMGMNSCGNSVPSAKFANDIDTVSYAYGIMFGQQYANFGDEGVVVPEKTMNVDNFLAGFSVAFTRDSANQKMSVEEAQQILNQFQMKMQQEMEAKRQKDLAENKEKGQAFMAENAKKDGVQTLESGLQIQVLKEGNGKQPKETDKVKVNYKGSLIDGTVFDQNDSIDFPLNGVVKGFKEGLLNMKEGGKAILTFPSDLGYGDRGAGKDIPAGATLQFEVELIEVLAAKK